MTRVFSAHAVSVDGYISGRTPDGDEEFGRGLGDAPMLFDWYFDGDTPSRVFDGFKLSEPSARFFDAIALEAGLVDEVILHQVPVLLGAGRSFFHELPEHVQLRLLEAIPAPGVTHLRYEVVR